MAIDPVLHVRRSLLGHGDRCEAAALGQHRLEQRGQDPRGLTEQRVEQLDELGRTEVLLEHPGPRRQRAEALPQRGEAAGIEAGEGQHGAGRHGGSF
jgi:hypothetical protein